jgi:hypothetical protein
VSLPFFAPSETHSSRDTIHGIIQISLPIHQRGTHHEQRRSPTTRRGNRRQNSGRQIHRSGIATHSVYGSVHHAAHPRRSHRIAGREPVVLPADELLRMRHRHAPAKRHVHEVPHRARSFICSTRRAMHDWSDHGHSNHDRQPHSGCAYRHPARRDQAILQVYSKRFLRSSAASSSLSSV